MKKTIIHVMRHGEVHNPEGILYGRLRGYRLSDLGQQMAQAGADYLQSLQADIQAVIASPLLRAQQTATPTAQAYGLKVQADTRLIEAANSFEGMAIHANPLALGHPRYWSRYANPLRPSWGEPYQEQVDRMRAAVSAAIDRVSGAEALLVSHQLPIWMLRSFAEGWPLPHDPRKRECSLGSITSFVFAGHTLLGIEYAEPSAHLLGQASDVTPGQSAAGVNTGGAK
ncbi:histidine phosphatase family protein [Boudabousia marimammalium]|uniref:Histidine phosphatase family protein n=1 Tax=Boudabousia marimammalium TaxID=156892 RepID=A0A1Q5PMD3_9ACTO|nr:histidine phosphatase family protein [Boudabousia marimammalium]OKL48704.1 histidine phosphatase family protein [Boudabousia marimammalium]